MLPRLALRDLAAAAGASSVWTGLERRDTTWRHLDGSPIAALRWAPLEPDGVDPVSCVAVDGDPSSPTHGQWSDEDCASRRAFTCGYAWPSPHRVP